jgi:2-oxo-hept-3-ene-1,7-dioate hydratase
MKIAEGRVLKGHKIGLTSKAMQASSQISEPDYGALLICSSTTAAIFPPTALSCRVSKSSWPSCWPNRCAARTARCLMSTTPPTVIPALELIDARCHNIDPETQRPRKVFDTISDNAANAGVILGGRRLNPTSWICAGSPPCCTATA